MTVYLNGKRTRTLRGHRRAVRVKFTLRPKGVTRVKLVVRTAHGRVTITRTYRTCTPKVRHRLKSHARPKKRRKGAR